MTLIFHFSGFLVLQVFVNNGSSRVSQIGNVYYAGSKTKKLLKWVVEFDDYGGLLQDFFLIPQIFSNTFWKIKGRRPLRKSYYLGFTSLRVLVHAYDYFEGSYC